MANNNEGYRVYMGDTPVTVPIVDKKRADLAFSVLNLMDDRGVEFKKDGETVEWGRYGLRILDSDGVRIEPELDMEWYGDEAGNNAAKEAALEKILADMIIEGAPYDGYGVKPDREFEARSMERYVVFTHAGTYEEDGAQYDNILPFTPPTWDIDKAGEIQNLMVYGMDPSIEMSYDGQVIDGVHIANMDGDVYEDRLNNNWTKEIMDNDQDFADAVAAIPANDDQMEQ